MAEVIGVETNSAAQTALDYSVLSREILVHLRGPRSQVELSQMLGYSFNQVGKWESGAVIIHWQDFIRLNEVLGLPWQKNFDDIFAFHSDMSIAKAHVFESLSRFFGYANLNDMAETLHKSRSSVSRLLHNQVKIQFADVLQVMDLRPFVLGCWLGKFLKPGSLASFAAKYESEIQIYRGLLALPYTSIVNAALHLDSYKELENHSPEWLAGRTGLSLEEVQNALHHLSSAGIIYLSGGKYTSVVFELTFLRVPEFRKVTQFLSDWTANSFSAERSRPPNMQNPSLSSVRVYPLSSEAGKEMVNALVVFHHQVAEIVKNDKGRKDHVRCLLMHCLDMGIDADFSQKETV